jgi:hypothetical protein
LLRKSIVDTGQRASTAAGLSFLIQDMCQCGVLKKSTLIQGLGVFAVH